jgi:hypothetical protein
LDLISSARSSPLHESFFSTSSTHKRLPSPSSSSKLKFLSFFSIYLDLIIGSRSPQRYLRSRDRFFRSYDQIEWGDRYQRAQELLVDFEDILLQINGDFLAKEEKFSSEIPIGVHIEDLPIEFTYV